MKNTAGPNETAQELENLRKKSIANIVQKKGKEGDETPESKETEKESQKNTEKSQKKLDIDQNISYIKEDESVDSKEDGDDTQTSEEEKALDEYKKVLEEQFNGDGRKAVKSWKEANRGYSKLRDKTKKMEEQIDAINSLVEENPMVKDILTLANQKGKVTKEDLQSFLGDNDRESKDKPESTTKSKLETVDNFDASKVSEDKLAESGYLDLSNKDLTPTSEWNLKVQQARLNYIAEEMPKRLVEETTRKIEQQIAEKEEERKRERQEKQNAEMTAKRYRNGLDRVIDEFNLDFAGNEEHEKLLDDIEALAVNIRDPQNPNVLHEDAMYLATMNVIRQKGLDVSSSKSVDEAADKAGKKAEEALDDKLGFNKSTKGTKGRKEPTTIAEKLTDKMRERYDQEQSWRRNYVLHGDKKQ